MSSLSKQLSEITASVRDLEHKFEEATIAVAESTYGYYYTKGALDYRDKLLDAIQSDSHMDKGVQALIRSLIFVTNPDPYQFTTSKRGLE